MNTTQKSLSKQIEKNAVRIFAINNKILKNPDDMHLTDVRFH